MNQAQVIKLDNSGKPDEEVIFYGEGFDLLVKILTDPITELRNIGPDFHQTDWNLKAPVTAILRPYVDRNSEGVKLSINSLSLSNIALLDHRFDLGPSLEAFGDVTEMVAEGSFIAQFAKSTHTLMITYIAPETYNIPQGINIAFSRPTAIVTEVNPPDPKRKHGTFHFDLETTVSDMRSYSYLRAVFIARHITNPDLYTYSKLFNEPFIASPPTLVNSGTPVQLQVPQRSAVVNTFHQVPNLDGKFNPVVIVEGLNDPTILIENKPVVCLQAGAVQVPDEPGNPNTTYHWEINGVIVKNYTESGG